MKTSFLAFFQGFFLEKHCFFAWDGFSNSSITSPVVQCLKQHGNGYLYKLHVQSIVSSNIIPGVVSVCFERQSTGELRVIAYPRQEGGGSVLAKQMLTASTGFSVASLEERVSAGKG